MPAVALEHLEQLWFQVSGTLCNLECTHCFVSAGPHNRSFGLLTLADVQARLAESQALGVREYYFTGGEPFLNRELVAMLVATLQYGPATVLTNANVLRDEWLVELARVAAASLYSLEFRVSLDGWTAEANDPIRGAGSFEATLAGIRKLVAHGFLPIITAARVWPAAEEPQAFARFIELLKGIGYDHPRLKILPTLHLGAEADRTHGYSADERITDEMLTGYDAGQLLCSHARLVSDRGVHVCPILLESPDSRLGSSLAESLGPFEVRHGACFTCYQHGAICSNPSGYNSPPSSAVKVTSSPA